MPWRLACFLSSNARTPGGLVASAALSEPGFLHGGETLRGLFTLATPHGGSDLSRWARYAAKLTSVLNDKIPDPGGQKTMRGTIKRMLDFVESRGVKEIHPGSAFLNSLPDVAPGGAYCFSAGGTNPALISIPGVLSFPNSLEKVVPSKLYPEEIAEGKGDGLVTSASSELPYANEHMDFHVNHAAIAVDKEVRTAVLARIKKHCL